MTGADGFVIIDKPTGVTSHDVVAQIRRKFGTRQVGHAGTLDPMATGVLVIGINRATKFLQYIVSGKKRYLATIRLGMKTTTDDREGDIIEVKSTLSVTDGAIESALKNFHGKISQVPSSVSAIKVAGKRAYELVREGKTVELKAREVEIFELQILKIDRNEHLDIEIEVCCSAGTYIRAIARDLGEKLQVGGHLIALRRTEVTPFEISQASKVEDSVIRPLSKEIVKVLPSRTITEGEAAEFRFGRRIAPSDFSEVGIALDQKGEVVAIIENRDSGAQPLTVFNP